MISFYSWGSLNILSTVVTIFALGKILAILQDVHINKNKMVVHAVLVTVHTGAIVITCLPYEWYDKIYTEVWTAEALLELFV